jgi:hypothetical protein
MEELFLLQMLMIHMYVSVISVALSLLTSWHLSLVFSCYSGTQNEVICVWILFLLQCLSKFINHER